MTAMTSHGAPTPAAHAARLCGTAHALGQRRACTFPVPSNRLEATLHPRSHTPALPHPRVRRYGLLLRVWPSGDDAEADVYKSPVDS